VEKGWLESATQMTWHNVAPTLAHLESAWLRRKLYAPVEQNKAGVSSSVPIEDGVQCCMKHLGSRQKKQRHGGCNDDHVRVVHACPTVLLTLPMAWPALFLNMDRI